MRLGFSKEEIEYLFSNMWKQVVKNQLRYFGKHYDLQGILSEFPTLQDKRYCIAYLIQIYSQPEKVEKDIQELMERHRIFDTPQDLESETIFLLWVWHNKDYKKVVVCKTLEMAKNAQKYWKEHNWKNT